MVIRVGTDIPCQPNLVSPLLGRLDLVMDIGNQPLKFTNQADCPSERRSKNCRTWMAFNAHNW